MASLSTSINLKNILLLLIPSFRNSLTNFQGISNLHKAAWISTAGDTSRKEGTILNKDTDILSSNNQTLIINPNINSHSNQECSVTPSSTNYPKIWTSQAILRAKVAAAGDKVGDYFEFFIWHRFCYSYMI